MALLCNWSHVNLQAEVGLYYKENLFIIKYIDKYFFPFFSSNNKPY